MSRILCSEFAERTEEIISYLNLVTGRLERTVLISGLVALNEEEVMETEK